MAYENTFLVNHVKEDAEFAVLLKALETRIYAFTIRSVNCTFEFLLEANAIQLSMLGSRINAHNQNILRAILIQLMEDKKIVETPVTYLPCSDKK